MILYLVLTILLKFLFHFITYAYTPKQCIFSLTCFGALLSVSYHIQFPENYISPLAIVSLTFIVSIPLLHLFLLL